MRAAWNRVQALLAGVCAAALLFGGQARATQSPNPDGLESRDTLRVLVYSRTTGFRHDSIPDGIECFENLGKEHGFEVVATEDPETFTDEGLEPFGVIVFLNTTGDVLNTEQQGAMKRFVRAGRGFMGVHSATDTHYGWEWYGQLVGAYFASHPAIQEADIHVVDRDHPSTQHIPGTWTRRDEWYDFRSQPNERVRVLLNLDETTYQGGRMGERHPIAWYHEFDGGRSFYTAGGHTRESYREPDFVRHLLGGLLWAADRLDLMPDDE